MRRLKMSSSRRRAAYTHRGLLANAYSLISLIRACAPEGRKGNEGMQWPNVRPNTMLYALRSGDNRRWRTAMRVHFCRKAHVCVYPVWDCQCVKMFFFLAQLEVFASRCQYLLSCPRFSARFSSQNIHKVWKPSKKQKLKDSFVWTRLKNTMSPG